MKILKQGDKGFFKSYTLYRKLMQSLGFPKISKQAIDIEYLYRYDGYLPQFLFSLSYKLPKTSKVKVYEKQNDGIIKIQTCLEDDRYKIVKYTEFME